MAAIISLGVGATVTHHDAIKAEKFCMAEDVVGPRRHGERLTGIQHIDGVVEDVPEELVTIDGTGACRLGLDVDIVIKREVQPRIYRRVLPHLQNRCTPMTGIHRSSAAYKRMMASKGVKGKP